MNLEQGQVIFKNKAIATTATTAGKYDILIQAISRSNWTLYWYSKFQNVTLFWMDNSIHFSSFYTVSDISIFSQAISFWPNVHNGHEK